MGEEHLVVFGDKGEVHVPVVRSGRTAYPCTAVWNATDDTALYGRHYQSNKGIIKFDADQLQ